MKSVNIQYIRHKLTAAVTQQFQKSLSHTACDCVGWPIITTTIIIVVVVVVIQAAAFT